MVLVNHPTLQDAVRARYTNLTHAQANDLTVEIAKGLEDPGCKSLVAEAEVIEHLNSGDNLPAPGQKGGWWVGELVKQAKREASRASPGPGTSPPEDDRSKFAPKEEDDAA